MPQERGVSDSLTRHSAAVRVGDARARLVGHSPDEGMGYREGMQGCTRPPGGARADTTGHSVL